jgi:DNA-binding IclR family transcriptional regulator
MAPVDVVQDDVLFRARAEYLEMPGLRLTRAQAQRLWGLDSRTCERLLSTLTESRFLAQTRDGAFVLSSSRI